MSVQRFVDADKTGYFVENGRLHKFSTYRGVRRVLPPSIVVEQERTTTACGQAKSLPRIIEALVCY